MRANEVTELDLRGKGLGLVEAHVIGSLVAVSTSLTACDLSGNYVGEEGEAALQKSVEGRSGFELNI